MTEMEYEQRLNEEAAEEAYIAERVEFYMQEGGVCDPYNPEAFCERLSEAVHDDCTVLQDRLEPLLKGAHRLLEPGKGGHGVRLHG